MHIVAHTYSFRADISSDRKLDRIGNDVARAQTIVSMRIAVLPIALIMHHDAGTSLIETLGYIEPAASQESLDGSWRGTTTQPLFPETAGPTGGAVVAAFVNAPLILWSFMICNCRFRLRHSFTKDS